MATTTTAHKDSAEFINTLGSFTDSGGQASLTLSFFHAVPFKFTAPNGITNFVYTAGALAAELGTAPFYLYQTYKIDSFELWITGTSFGGHPPQSKAFMNFYMTEWALPPSGAGGDLFSIKPMRLPGTKWKTFTIPQTEIGAGTGGEGTRSSGDNQILSQKCTNPVYFIDVFGTAENYAGNKVASDPLPTFGSRGIDTTYWQGILFQYQQSLGTLAKGQNWFISTMYKVSVTFKGIRIQRIPAEVIYRYEDDEFDTETLRIDHQECPNKFRSNVKSLGSDFENACSIDGIPKLRRTHRISPYSTDRPVGNKRRRPETLPQLHPVRQSQETPMGRDICTGTQQHVDQTTGTERRQDDK